MRPTQLLDMLAGENFMYILYFQEPGVAEADLGKDVRKTIRGFMYVASGDVDRSEIQWGRARAGRDDDRPLRRPGGAPGVARPRPTSTSTPVSSSGSGSAAG